MGVRARCALDVPALPRAAVPAATLALWHPCAAVAEMQRPGRTTTNTTLGAAGEALAPHVLRYGIVPGLEFHWLLKDQLLRGMGCE
jgi:hypothetical protein